MTHNLHDISQVAIRQAMQDAGGSLSQAALRLGISRQTLYRKLSVLVRRVGTGLQVT